MTIHSTLLSIFQTLPYYINYATNTKLHTQLKHPHTHTQHMETKIEENGLKRGPWTPEEDRKLVDCIQKYGHGSWKELPKVAGLNRCGKSCRLRWTNYLRPDIKRGAFTDEEERVIIDLHAKLGNKWSAIASYLPGRTDNEIKNFYNTRLKKKLLQTGIDPDTHMPKTHLDTLLPLLPQYFSYNESRNLTWESVVCSHEDATRMAKVILIGNILQLLNTAGASVSPPLPIGNFGPSLESARFLNRWDSPAMGLQLERSSKTEFNTMETNNDLETRNNEFMESSIMHTEYAMPVLVSESPVSLSIDQAPNSFISPDEFPNPPTTFEGLEDLMDDEASNCYWKQVLE